MWYASKKFGIPFFYIKKKGGVIMPRGLTLKQQKFLEAIPGADSLSDAARKAGYTNRPGTASQQVMQSNIMREAVRAKLEETKQAIGLTAMDRRRLWQQIALDDTQSTKDRLKATELSARADGDFLDRVQLSSDPSAPVVVMGATVCMSVIHQARQLILSLQAAADDTPPPAPTPGTPKDLVPSARVSHTITSPEKCISQEESHPKKTTRKKISRKSAKPKESKVKEDEPS